MTSKGTNKQDSSSSRRSDSALSRLEKRCVQFKSMQRDALRWRALMTHCRIEHIDDRDMEPVFEVQPPCIWTKQSFVQAIDAVRHKTESGCPV